MLRTLLRRSRRQRKRAVLLARKRQITTTRQGHLTELAELAKKKGFAAAKIQAMKRRWDAIIYVNKLRLRKAAAIQVQAIWRGRIGRKEAQERRLKLLRVVPNNYQMTQLRKRCIVIGRFGNWQELRDSHTNHIFYSGTNHIVLVSPQHLVLIYDDRNITIFLKKKHSVFF